MKKVISILLVLCMMVSTLTINISALTQEGMYEIPNCYFWAKASGSFNTTLNIHALFDGSLGYMSNGAHRGFWTYWVGGGKYQNTNQWLAVDLGNVHKLNGIYLEDSGYSHEFNTPTAYNLYVSEDGTDYESLVGEPDKYTGNPGLATVAPTISEWTLIGNFTSGANGSLAKFDEIQARYVLIVPSESATTFFSIEEFHAYSSEEVIYDFETDALDSSTWMEKSWVNTTPTALASVREGGTSEGNKPYIMVDMGENININRVVTKGTPSKWYTPDKVNVYTAASEEAYASKSSDAWTLVAENVEFKGGVMEAKFMPKNARYIMIDTSVLGVHSGGSAKDWGVFFQIYAYGYLMGDNYEIPNTFFEGKASCSADMKTDIQAVFDGDSGYVDADGDDAGYWRESAVHTQEQGTWLAFDLADTYDVTKISFDDVNDVNVSLPSEFSIYTSNDNSAYEMLKGYTEGGNTDSVTDPDLTLWNHAGDYTLGEYENIIDVNSANTRFLLMYITADADQSLGIGEIHFYSGEKITDVDYLNDSLDRTYWNVKGWNGETTALTDNNRETRYGGEFDETPYFMVDLNGRFSLEKLVLKNAYPNKWYSPELVNVYVSESEEAFEDKNSDLWQLVAENAEYRGAVAEIELTKSNARYIMVKSASIGNDAFGNEKSEIYFNEVYAYGEELVVYYEIPRILFDVKTSKNSNKKLNDSCLLDSEIRYLDSVSEERGYWAEDLSSTQSAGTWIAVDMGAEYRINRIVLEDDGYNSNVAVPTAFDVYSSNNTLNYTSLKGYTPGGNSSNVVNPNLSAWNKIGSFTGGKNGATVKFEPLETRYLLIYVTEEASSCTGIGELRVYSDVEAEKIDYTINAVDKTGWTADAWKVFGSELSWITDGKINNDYEDGVSSGMVPYVMIDMGKTNEIDRVVVQHVFASKWYMADALDVYTSLDEDCMSGETSSTWELVAENTKRTGSVYDVEFIEKPARYLMFKVSELGVNMIDVEKDWLSFGEVFAYSSGKRTIIPVGSVSTEVDYANMICTVSVTPGQTLYDGSVGMKADVYDGSTLLHSETVRHFDDNNNLSFTFELPEATAADRIFKVRLGGNFDEEVNINISGTSSLDGNFDTLRGTTDIDSFKDELNNNIFNTYRIDLSDLEVSDTLEELVYNGLFNKRSLITAANFTKLVKEEIVYNVFKLKLTEMITDDFCKKYSSVITVDMSDDSVFAKLSKENRDSIIESVCDTFTDIQSISKIFYDKTELTAFQSLSREEMDNLIQKYLSSSSAYSKYMSLNAYYKAEVATDIAGATINSIDDIFTIFENSVEVNQPSHSGSTGGSGGGSGGSGAFISRIVNTSNKIVEQPQMKPCMFEDISDVLWAKYAIEQLYDKGIINGKSETLFDPNGSVTRSEIIKMLMSFEKAEISEPADVFSDVTEKHWAYRYIHHAYKTGLAKGFEGGSFMPDMFVSREDAAVFVYRYFKSKGMSFDVEENAEFTDYEKISDYAKEAVNALTNAGIINGFGDGSFKPAENCSRAMIAKIIYELVK